MKNNKVSQRERSASAPLQCHKPPPHRILVVDDEPSIREISAAMPAGSGYHVDVAKDGEAGWEALQAKHYDLLFTCDELLDTVKKVLRTTDSARGQIGPLPIWQSQPSAAALCRS